MGKLSDVDLYPQVVEAYAQQMERLMRADAEMLAAVKDSEEHPTDVTKVPVAAKGSGFEIGVL